MRLVPIGLSCLLLSAAPAAPQSPAVPAPPPPPEPPPSFYETTTVRARPVDTSTAAVDVVPAAEMEAAGARSGSDALRDVSGVNLVSNGGRAGVTNAWIRGADPNFTLVLLDGVPLNDSTELQGGAVNFEEAPAALLDRVEVVRGPLTSFYGTSSLSGVVQLFSPRGGPGPVRAAAGAEAGDASLRRGFGRVSGPAGAGGWSAGASYDAEEHRVADDRFRQLDGFGTADVVLAADARLALSGRLATGEQDDYPDSSGGPVYGSGETRHTEHDDLAASARLTLGGEPSATQQIFLGVSRRALERTSPAVPPLVPESAESTTFTRLRAAWTRPFARGARTTLDGGVTAEGEWGRNRSVLRLPPALGGDVPGDYDRSRGSGGAFAAVRHERGAVRLEAALRADVASGDSLQLHPHAGVVWRPGRGATRIHVSAGRASKLPSFFALASPPALGGNPALRPERTLGGEAGVDRALSGGRLELGASYFLHEYRDLVDFDFDQFLHVNRARVRTQGAELAIAWKPHPSLDVAAQATYVDARDLSGAPLLFEPRWIGSGRITWRPADRLVLRADLRAVSRYLDRQYPVPDRDAVDGRGLLGAAVSWRAAGGLRLRARADNLTDRAYETQIGFPGPGRSIWAGVGWERP